MWTPTRAKLLPSSSGAGSVLLLAGLFLIMAGCMGADAGATDNNNNNVQTCQYSVGVTPFSPRIGDVVELEASWTGSCAPRTTDAYDWTITGPDAESVAYVTRQGGRLVELVPTRAGSHQVGLAVDDITLGIVSVSRSITVVDPTGVQKSYLLRLTPPLDSGAPRQHQVLVVTGGTPISDRLVTLDEGVVVQNQLQGPSGSFGAYLRFTESGFPSYRELRVPSSGQFSMPVLPSSLYDVMVVPDGAEPAPARLIGQSVSSLLASGTFLFDAGVGVVGYVEDHLGVGVGQAQAVLRSGSLPSSVAVTDSYDGRFVVRARPGPQGLEVLPAEGLGLPRVRLPDAAGIQLNPGGGLGLRVRFGDVPRAQVTVTVTAGPSGAEEPVAAARVTLEATDLGVVGTVRVTQDGSELAELEAPGSFLVTSVTDASGAIGPLMLPEGTYRVVIEAPSGAPEGYGTTVVGSVEVTGGQSTLPLSLALPGLLEGVVLDDLLLPVEGVRVVAITRVGVGSATETTTDSTGSFSLDVIRGARYSLLLMPPSGLELSRRVVEELLVGYGDLTWAEGPGPGGELLLPRGLRLEGRVVFQADGLPGVLIQAIPSGEAGDPVLAEALTGPAGDFSLMVPDPGHVE